MAHIDADRVLVTSSTTGTGNITLLGTVSGYRGLDAVGVADGDTVDLYLEDVLPATGVPTGAWECGTYTWRTGGILERTTVRGSSNAGAAVDWPVGMRRIGMGMLAYMVAATRAVYQDLTAIETVSSNIASVNAVAGVDAEVAAVAPHVADVSTLAPHAVDVSTVAPHAIDVSTVAPHVTALEAVVPHVSSIDAVGPHAANVSIIAPHIADVVTVAPHVTNIDTLAPHATDVSTVAPHAVDVSTIAPHIADVTTVAPHVTNIDTVAPHVSAIDTVAPHVANVDTVAPHVTNLDTVAPHVDAIDTVAPHVTAIETVAPHVGNVDTVAPHVGNIDTVAPHVANVDTVAAHAANVDTVAANITSVDTVAADIGNVDIVAGDKPQIDTVSANIAAVLLAAANIIGINAAPGAAASASAALSSALALYGGAQSLNDANTLTAGLYGQTLAQAQLAQTAAASASSVLAQDLSAVTAAALHRSPNPVVAMVPYITANDSDGGAWTDRCGGTSWFNEALNGTWLPPTLSGFSSEMDARDYFGSIGAASLLTGDSSNFAGGVGNWAVINANGTVTQASGRLRITQTAAIGNVCGGAVAITTVVGQRYRIDLTLATGAATNMFVSAGTSSGNNSLASLNLGTAIKSGYLAFVATGTTTYINFYGATNMAPGTFAEMDDITVKPVDLTKNPSGSFYQSSADGKFYRLWKNLFSQSEFPNGPTDSSQHVGLITATTMAGYGGAIAFGWDGAATNYVYKTGPANATVTFTAIVKMDDGNAPAFGSSSISAASNSFSIILGANSTNPTTYISVLQADGTYRVSVTAPSGATVSNFGIIKYATNDNRTFKTTGWQVQFGSSFDSYEAKTTDGSQTETFRGNTAKFPRLAAIVAEAANVTIYDLTQPGRPMWRRMNFASAGHTFATVAALNGTLLAGSNGASGYLYAYDFARGSRRRWYSAGYQEGPFETLGALATVYPAPDVSSTIKIVNNTVNAVAMTVLPDAPVDPVTGLQVPTIAVGTAGGISVIQNNGTVVNSSSTFNMLSVAINSKSLMVSISASASPQFALNPGSLAAAFAMTALAYNAAPYVNPTLSVGAAITQHAARRDQIAFRAGSRVSMLRLNESTPASSLVAHVDSGYSTGWMTGDIRRCWLSSNVAENITATERVTNGTFDTDTTGWNSYQSGTLAVDTARLKITNSVTSSGAATQAVTTVPGKTYTFSVNVTYGTSGTAIIRLGSAGNGSLEYVSKSAPGNGVYTLTFTPTTATTTISLYTGTTVIGDTCYFDSVSVQEVVADRSYKAKPLTIYGTLANTAVAAAAQLMFWSGWSATNYLQEAYSADLDFGTGAWRVGAWVSIPASLSVTNFPEISADLMSNGGFDSDTVWQKGTGWSIAGGVATHAVGALSNIGQGTATANKTYKFTWTASGATAGSTLAVIGSTASAAQALNGTFTVIIKAPSASSFAIQATSTFDGSIDNVSVKETGIACIFDRAAATGAYIKAGVLGEGSLAVEAYDGTTTRRATSASAYNTATPLKASFEYSTSGTLSVGVNGVQVGSTTGAPLLTLNNASAVTTIGNSRTLDAAFPGSIALVKPTATVPTLEQKQFMYAQEQAMFQPGAQVTLPDSGAVVDMDYDPMLDRWKVISAANESSFQGLVRTSSAAVSSGSFTKVSHRSGVKLLARSTTNPGVDVSIPAYALREELFNRAERAAALARLTQCFDYTGGFTATETNASTQVTSIAGWTAPAQANQRGVGVTGTNIPANTTLADYSGTTGYLSAAATAGGSAQQVSLTGFRLPPGFEAVDVYAGALGSLYQKIEGASNDYTRSFDGFCETINMTPGYNARVHINARRVA